MPCKCPAFIKLHEATLVDHYRMFKRYFLWLALFVACASLAQVRVRAQLPPRDLTVELRQVEERKDALNIYNAGSAGTSREWPPFSLVIRNGEKGVLRMLQSVPMPWVQSVQSQSSALKISDASASSSAGGVTQALIWFDVGQSIAVTPKWPGGKKDVTLELELQQADMHTVHNVDLPRQTRSQITTIITVPLDTWVTIAVSGKQPLPAGTYSSEDSVDARRLLQVRAIAP